MYSDCNPVYEATLLCRCDRLPAPGRAPAPARSPYQATICSSATKVLGHPSTCTSGSCSSLSRVAFWWLTLNKLLGHAGLLGRIRWVLGCSQHSRGEPGPLMSMLRCGATVSAYQSLRLRTFHYQVQRHGAEHRLRLPMSAEVQGRSINLACTVS